MTTEERIVQSAAEGSSPRELAAAHGLSEPEVLAILDREAERRFSGENLRRELLLEAERLTKLEEHYYAKALGGGDGANAAGALYCKLAERKAVLLGLNAPVASASVTISQTVEATKLTSMQRLFEAISRLKARPNGELPAPEPSGEAE